MNSDLPLVSIVALCYNQAKYAVETLDSIIAQTYPNIQLIIIDDCSTDNSVEVIQNWIDEKKTDCEFVKHSTNLGITKTCNDGLRRVKGEYYQILACDDIILSTKIANQVKYFEKCPSVVVVFGQAVLFDEKSNKLDEFFVDPIVYKSLVTQQDYTFALRRSNIICAPSVLVRTKNVAELGGYDEGLSFEDWDLWLRISGNKLDFKIVDDIVCMYRISKNSITTKRNFEMLIGFYNLFLKHEIREKVTISYFFNYYSRIGLINNLKILSKIIFNNDWVGLQIFLLVQWNSGKRYIGNFINYQGGFSAKDNLH